MKKVALFALVFVCGACSKEEMVTPDPSVRDSSPGSQRRLNAVPARASSLRVSSFVFPDEALRNNDRKIGPFCCTGQTAVVQLADGSEVGYAYFFNWRGQAVMNKDAQRSFAPDMELQLAGKTSLTERDAPLAMGSIAIPAAKLIPGSIYTATVGRVQYTLTILQAEVIADPCCTSVPRFDMQSLKTRLDINLVTD